MGYVPCVVVVVTKGFKDVAPGYRDERREQGGDGAVFRGREARPRQLAGVVRPIARIWMLSPDQRA